MPYDRLDREYLRLLSLRCWCGRWVAPPARPILTATWVDTGTARTGGLAIPGATGIVSLVMERGASWSEVRVVLLHEIAHLYLRAIPDGTEHDEDHRRLLVLALQEAYGVGRPGWVRPTPTDPEPYERLHRLAVRALDRPTTRARLALTAILRAIRSVPCRVR